MTSFVLILLGVLCCVWAIHLTKRGVSWWHGVLGWGGIALVCYGTFLAL
jgi:hypothetical protein